MQVSQAISIIIISIIHLMKKEMLMTLYLTIQIKKGKYLENIVDISYLSKPKQNHVAKPDFLV